jgi:hypothetical protein
MRFAIIRKADEQTEAGAMPTEELMADMLRYNEEMAKAGIMFGGEGLRPSREATRVSFQGGRPTIVDGPFTEAKELIAGFTLINVKSREEAMAWVLRWPEPDVVLELRPIYEMEDFGEAFTPELREQEDRLRERATRNA